MATRLRAARFVTLMTRLLILTVVSVVSTWLNILLVLAWEDPAPAFYTIDVTFNAIACFLSFSQFQALYEHMWPGFYQKQVMNSMNCALSVERTRLNVLF